ncbi:DUF4920 domain-containing protein [Aquimarina rhabdastrellae]
MKKTLLCVIAIATLLSCNTKKETPKEVKEEVKEEVVIKKETKEIKNAFGEPITATSFLDKNAIAEKYNTLKAGDTLSIAFESTVNSVCQAKGCWMKLALEDDKHVMVKFKDYGFFVPKDIADKNVVVQGKAYVSEMSVDEQKHFAKDAGKSEEEIAAITAPKRTYSFMAEGVLVK